jgi:CHAD domain-containing protein
LNVSRNTKLQYAKTIARSLKIIDITQIVDKIGVSEKELQKRYSKIISKLVTTMQAMFPVILTNTSKLEELHDLRIACKKLKYLLELSSDENKTILNIGRNLQKLQDILGAIHDYDFTIEFLRSLARQPLEIQEIIALEKEERNTKYGELLAFCKRRLQISPDSFLISLRNLNFASS